MTDHFDVDALGSRIRITFDDALPADIVETVRAAWVDAAPSQPGEPDAIVQVLSHLESDAIVERTTAAITLAAMERAGMHLLMLNAAGVADEQGRVAAFVGGSGRGKTDLSRALGRDFDYVSDGAVGVEPGGRVLPHRAPLSIVRDGAPKQHVAPSALGLRVGGDAPLQLASITLLERDAGASAPTLEALDFCDAVAEVVPQTNYLASLPTPLQTLAGLVDRVGGFTRLRYSDADSVAPRVPELLDHRGPAEPWHAVTVPADVQKTGMLGGRFTASAVLDAVRFHDRTAIFTRGRIRVLDGIGPTVWDALCAGRDLDGIVDDLVHEFGAPPEGDARTIVRAALDEFVFDGILALA